MEMFKSVALGQETNVHEGTFLYVLIFVYEIKMWGCSSLFYRLLRIAWGVRRTVVSGTGCGLRNSQRINGDCLAELETEAHEYYVENAYSASFTSCATNNCEPYQQASSVIFS
jgi:hypothetical protein